jgi:DNA-binding MarR family transcriptional regulator
MNAGKTLSASWAMRTTNPSFTTKEVVVLYAFISFMDADGFSSPGTARLMFVTRLGKASVRRAIEILEQAGMIRLVRPHTDERCAGYVVNVDKIAHAESVCPPSDVPTPRTLGPVMTHPVLTQDPPCTHTGPTPSASSDPFEDHEDQNRILEDSSPSLATSQAPIVTSPSTARSPTTMPPAQEPLPTPTPTKQKKPRATKPKLAPLAVEALTPDERAVHDAIVQDVTLSQICHNVPQLARDLVNIAAGRIDVVAKVKALAVWNRNNPSKAWTTVGGNRGLTSCVTRDANQTSYPYPSTRSSGNVAPANATSAPPSPAIVDLAKHPELAPRPMRSARF